MVRIESAAHLCPVGDRNGRTDALWPQKAHSDGSSEKRRGLGTLPAALPTVPRCGLHVYDIADTYKGDHVTRKIRPLRNICF